DPARRPESLYFYWLTPRGVVLDGAFPERGKLPAPGQNLGTLFLDRRAPAAGGAGLAGPPDRAGGGWRIAPTGERRIFRRLLLGGPLPDEDKDGVPDLVERNCLVPGAMSCPTPPPPDGAPPPPAPPRRGAPPRRRRRRRHRRPRGRPLRRDRRRHRRRPRRSDGAR